MDVSRWWRPLPWPTIPLLSEMGSKTSKAQSALRCQPSGNYRPMQMQHIVAVLPPKNIHQDIGSKKLSTSRAHTRRQQGTHCMHLPPWPDGLLWAGLRYLRWTWQWSRVGRRGTFHVRAKQGIVSRASGPTPGIWRTHIVRTQGPKHTHLTHMRLVLCSYAETLLMLLCLCLIIWLFQCDFVCGRCPSKILLLANCFGGRGNKLLNNLKLIWNHGCSWPMEHRQELQDGCDHKCSYGDLGDSNTPDLKHQYNHSWFKSSYTLCLSFTNCGGIFTMPWS